MLYTFKRNFRFILLMLLLSFEIKYLGTNKLNNVTTSENTKETDLKIKEKYEKKKKLYLCCAGALCILSSYVIRNNKGNTIRNKHKYQSKSKYSKENDSKTVKGGYYNYTYTWEWEFNTIKDTKLINPNLPSITPVSEIQTLETPISRIKTLEKPTSRIKTLETPMDPFNNNTTKNTDIKNQFDTTISVLKRLDNQKDKINIDEIYEIDEIGTIEIDYQSQTVYFKSSVSECGYKFHGYSQWKDKKAKLEKWMEIFDIRNFSFCNEKDDIQFKFKTNNKTTVELSKNDIELLGSQSNMKDVIKVWMTIFSRYDLYHDQNVYNNVKEKNITNTQNTNSIALNLPLSSGNSISEKNIEKTIVEGLGTLSIEKSNSQIINASFTSEDGREKKLSEMEFFKAEGMQDSYYVLTSWLAFWNMSDANFTIPNRLDPNNTIVEYAIIKFLDKDINISNEMLLLMRNNLKKDFNTIMKFWLDSFKTVLNEYGTGNTRTIIQVERRSTSLTNNISEMIPNNNLGINLLDELFNAENPVSNFINNFMNGSSLSSSPSTKSTNENKILTNESDNFKKLSQEQKELIELGKKWQNVFDFFSQEFIKEEKKNNVDFHFSFLSHPRYCKLQKTRNQIFNYINVLLEKNISTLSEKEKLSFKKNEETMFFLKRDIHDYETLFNYFNEKTENKRIELLNSFSTAIINRTDVALPENAQKLNQIIKKLIEFFEFDEVLNSRNNINTNSKGQAFDETQTVYSDNMEDDSEKQERMAYLQNPNKQPVKNVDDIFSFSEEEMKDLYKEETNDEKIETNSKTDFLNAENLKKLEAQTKGETTEEKIVLNLENLKILDNQNMKNIKKNDIFDSMNDFDDEKTNIDDINFDDQMNEITVV